MVDLAVYLSHISDNASLHLASLLVYDTIDGCDASVDDSNKHSPSLGRLEVKTNVYHVYVTLSIYIHIL